ncbi:MAG TPA: hypothetical protein VGI45_33480 [Terracidiphilus sp.]|jgi:photosystem II stability/assembly factor-like uncharacterized protein
MRTTLILSLITITATAHAQFTLQTSNTTADLRGIHNVGNGVAWASGTDGTVLRTEDGGFVWQSCSVPPGAEKLDFRGIQAFDADTAIVMSSGKGDQSRLYKTTDGCHTWKLLFTNPDKDGFFDAILLYFSDPQHGSGWLLGDPVRDQFTLYRTFNSGKSWSRQENVGLRAMPDQQGAFAASNSSMIQLGGELYFGTGGKQGAKIFSQVILACKDSCPPDPHGRIRRWNIQPAPVGGQSEASGIFSIAGREGESSVLVSVGGDYTKSNDADRTAAFTADGGKTWTASTTPPHGYRSTVAYDPTTKSWITVGPNGADISTDDGRNWHPVHLNPALHESPDADRNWNALSLPYVVGPKGRIGKLDDAALKR